MWMRKTSADWLAGAVADVIPEVFLAGQLQRLRSIISQANLNIEYEKLKLDFVSSGKVFSHVILSLFACKLRNELEEETLQT